MKELMRATLANVSVLLHADGSAETERNESGLLKGSIPEESEVEGCAPGTGMEQFQ